MYTKLKILSNLSIPIFRTSSQRIGLLIVAMIALGLMCVNSLPALAQTEDAEGYYYTVQTGDSWPSVASATGLTVEELQAANPDSVRENGWLLDGEELFVPTGDTVIRKTHIVQAGESWNSIASEYSISVALLQAANPQAIHVGFILYKGEQLVIPPAASEGEPTATTAATTTATATSTATPTPTPTATSTATAIPTATLTDTPATETTTEEATTEETPTATDATTSTLEIEVPSGEDAAEDGAASDTGSDAASSETESSETESEESTDTTDTADVTDPGDATDSTTPITETTTTTATAATSVTVSVPCPDIFADYPDVMVELLNTDGPEALGAFLTGCNALVDDGLVSGNLNGDDVDDLVVVYENPNQETPFVEGDLAIFGSGDEGYTLDYRARAAGEVRLLSIEDVNEDGLSDVVWVDTTCGASTCFDTVNVRSWDGDAWTDWTNGTITMAYAEINLEPVSEDGQALNIVLDGGIYGSVGAGPQRSRAEVWSSLDGAPYVLVEKTYHPSECLYHTVLDANRAFLDDESDDFAAAEALYTQAATDEELIKCWVRNSELEELRSFSLFRLALIAGYQGDTESAASRVTELSVTYPGSIFADVGETWLSSYQAENDVAQACADITEYAETVPETWEVLADYGYTNPSFEADDVCPVLDIVVSDADAEDSEGEGDAGDTGEENTGEGNSGAENTEEGSNSAILPDCPADLAGYAETLPDLLAGIGGDETSIESWMSGCGTLSEDLGDVVLTEINGDGVADAIFFPTLITDAGFGPDGSQGTVLIYHSQPDADSGYELIANPQIYGEPAPLAVDDLNDDGRMDVAWTVIGCSTFCVLEVQMWTWDGDAYVSLIQPGAIIAEGEATLAPVPAGDPGDGQELIISGGVSGTPEGGLAVPHEERWQSMEGGLYQRVAWSYEKSVEGGACLGLHLIEADVAMQASSVLGYGPALELYTSALDPALQACSIFGLAADKELVLLQGLAAFRLIQTHALSGDTEAAQSTLEVLTAGQPDGLYTELATTWLDELTSNGDPAATCEAVRPFIEENIDLWQITDHFGYNHPALAAEQLCYIP